MGKSDITSKIKVHEIRLPEQALLSLPIPYFPSPLFSPRSQHPTFENQRASPKSQFQRRRRRPSIAFSFMAKPRMSPKTTTTTLITTNPSPPFSHYLLPVSPLTTLLFSPKTHRFRTPKPSSSLPIFYLSLLFSITFLGISILNLIPYHSEMPCSHFASTPSLSPMASLISSKASNFIDGDPRLLSTSVMVPLPAHGFVGANLSVAEREFWEQPNGEGFRPCLDFGLGYRKSSAKITKERKRFLVVVASGGLNQQRNQIVDAVVIARVLEAALVVPVLQVNLIWGDERF